MRKEFSLFDDDDNLVAKHTTYGDVLSEGWIVMYKKPLQHLVLHCTEYSKVRVFAYLSSLQSYDSVVYTTISDVSKQLNLNYKTTWNAIIWLEKNQYLIRTVKNGSSGFILNPQITTCGKKSLKEKKFAWKMSFLDSVPDENNNEGVDNDERINESE